MPAYSDRIFSWTPLKPQHSNPNPLANQLASIDFLNPHTPLIIPQRLLASLESLMPPKNWCLVHARCSKNCLKHSIRFCGIFSMFKIEFYCKAFFKMSSRPDCIFEIHLLWQSGFSRVYSNCCCSCSFEAKSIKIGLSPHKLYSNNIMNFQDSTRILNACKKNSGNLMNWLYIYIYIIYNIYIYIYIYIYIHAYEGVAGHFFYMPKCVSTRMWYVHTFFVYMCVCARMRICLSVSLSQRTSLTCFSNVTLNKTLNIITFKPYKLNLSNYQ